MKISNQDESRGFGRATLLSSFTHINDGPGNKSPRQGIWRGEFVISETHIPFNFEYNAKDQEHPVLTLLNGTRRDDF